MSKGSWIRWLVRVWAVAAVVWSVSASHEAAAREYGLPPGQWRQTCQNAYVQGGWLLRATCLNDEGRWRDASFDLRTCNGGLTNRDARLHCDNSGGWGGGGGGYGGLPGGSWRGSCRNAYIEGGWLLRAQCINREGAWRDASYDTRQCNGGLGVNDARLFCEGSGGGGNSGGGYGGVPGFPGIPGLPGGGGGNRPYNYGLPGGPWRNECRNAYVEGGYLMRATCRNDKGNWRDASLDLRQCRNNYAYANDARLSCN